MSKVQYHHTLEEMKENFYLEDGVLYHARDKGKRKRKGDRVGDGATKGRRTTRLNGHPIAVARVVWSLHNDTLPRGVIDHKDRNERNDHPDNLRDVPQVVNTRNNNRRKSNTSGITGVRKHSKKGKWEAHITVSKRWIGLYYGIDFFEACCARKSAEKRYGFLVVT